VNDAEQVSAALHGLGFEVTNLSAIYEPQQMTRQNIKKALYDFALVIKETGGFGLVYFSGHGVERNGQMYLAPYDSYVRFEQDFEEELIPIHMFYDAFRYAGNPMNLLIIDACRDNPWTRPVAKFNQINYPSPQISAENVILATSTLSGEKADDGKEDVSPFADAFVHSVMEADFGLGKVSEQLSRIIRRLRQKNPTAEVPTINGLAGRDFVFDPTLKTFNLEQEAFNTGKQLGNRDLLNDLLWNYSAGYFYKSAKDYLDTAPLAPQSASAAVPTRIVMTNGSYALRNLPSTKADIAEIKPAGTRLAVVAEGPKSRNGDQWYTVAIDRPEPAYVLAKRVQTISKANPIVLSNLLFDPGQQAGVEQVATESAAEIRRVMGGENKNTITRVTVVGYGSTAAEGNSTAGLQLIGRQAAVVREIAETGFDGSKIAVVVAHAKQDANLGAVDLFLNSEAEPPSVWGASAPRSTR